MEIKASAKYLRISPKKARPMADALRGLNVNQALAQLSFHPSKSARLFYKLIHSAVSNAKNNYNLKEDNLKISTITVDTGPTFKRAWFRSHGSSDRLLKRTSNFKVVVGEIKPTVVKKAVTISAKSTAKPTDKLEEEKKIDTSSLASTANPLLDKKSIRAQKGIKKIFSRNTTNK